MSNFYYLNQTPHSLWDLIADLGDQGFSAYSQPPSYNSREGENQPNPPNQDHAGGQTGAPEQEAKAGASADESRPEPATRGLGENSEEKEPDNPPQDLPFRGRACHGGRGGKHKGPGAGASRGCGPGARFRHCGGHPSWGRRPFPFGRPGTHNRPRGGPGAAPFDLPAFLRNLGSQLGINLNEVIDNVRAWDADSHVDFTPRTDIFDTPTHFLVHASLPGAQRPDVCVDYDAENSTLRLAGVVYRPGVDEALNAALIVDGRSREVGVFEREVRLGTRENPANVDANRISAKLTDGVLVVVLPKVVSDEGAGRRKVTVEHVEQDKEEKTEKEAEADAMQVESETEAGDEVMGEDKDALPHRAYVEEEEDEEKEYVTVDVD